MTNENDGPKRRKPAARTKLGMGPPQSPAAPSTAGSGATELDDESTNIDAPAGLVASREPPAPTNLEFVPPPGAPKVEVDSNLEREAELRAAQSGATPRPKPPARKPAPETELMADVQRRRAEQQREPSDLPLMVGLAFLALIIAGGITYFVYRLRYGP